MLAFCDHTLHSNRNIFHNSYSALTSHSSKIISRSLLDNQISYFSIHFINDFQGLHTIFLYWYRNSKDRYQLTHPGILLTIYSSLIWQDFDCIKGNEIYPILSISLCMSDKIVNYISSIPLDQRLNQYRSCIWTF
jgi:hypothetical protein